MITTCWGGGLAWSLGVCGRGIGTRRKEREEGGEKGTKKTYADTFLSEEDGVCEARRHCASAGNSQQIVLPELENCFEGEAEAEK